MDRGKLDNLATSALTDKHSNSKSNRKIDSDSDACHMEHEGSDQDSASEIERTVMCRDEDQLSDGGDISD